PRCRTRLERANRRVHGVRSFVDRGRDPTTVRGREVQSMTRNCFARLPKSLVGFVLSILVSTHAAAGPNETPVPKDHARKMKQGLELFRTFVRPALIRNCLDCHGGKKTRGDLDLST